MSRVGRAVVNIPIAEIVAECEETWLPEITDAIATELLKETRRQARMAFSDHTGNLRKSIRKRKSRFDKNMVIVSATAPHAHLVEYGTDLRVDPRTGKTSGHMPASPFLRLAAEAVRARLPEIIARVVNK